MKIFQALGGLSNTNSNVNVVSVDIPKVEWDRGLSKLHKELTQQLQHYFVEDPDEEDETKCWMRYEYDNIHLYIILDAITNTASDFEGFYHICIPEDNPLYDVLNIVEQNKHIITVVIDNILANGTGTRVYKPGW